MSLEVCSQTFQDIRVRTLRDITTAEQFLGMLQSELVNPMRYDTWKEKAILFLDGGPCFPFVETLLQELRNRIERSQQLIAIPLSKINLVMRIRNLVEAIQLNPTPQTSTLLKNTLVGALETSHFDFDLDVMPLVLEGQNYLEWEDYVDLVTEIGLRNKRFDNVTQMFSHKTFDDDYSRRFFFALIMTNQSIIQANEWIADDDNDLSWLFQDDEEMLEDWRSERTIVFEEFDLQKLPIHGHGAFVDLYHIWFRRVATRNTYITEPPSDMMMDAALLERIWYDMHNKEYVKGYFLHNNQARLQPQNDFDQDVNPLKRVSEDLPEPQRQKYQK